MSATLQTRPAFPAARSASRPSFDRHRIRASQTPAERILGRLGSGEITVEQARAELEAIEILDRPPLHRRLRSLFMPLRQRLNL